MEKIVRWPVLRTAATAAVAGAVRGGWTDCAARTPPRVARWTRRGRRSCAVRKGQPVRGEHADELFGHAEADGRHENSARALMAGFPPATVGGKA